MGSREEKAWKRHYDNSSSSRLLVTSAYDFFNHNYQSRNPTVKEAKAWKDLPASGICFVCLVISYAGDRHTK
jgi:hypothetical protein